MPRGPLQPRQWRKPLTAAVTAYRQLLHLVRQKDFQVLNLSQVDQLAANCPRCFGPPVDSEPNVEEPNIILCVDGNFQHRRHQAASQEIPGADPPTPELFMDPRRVEQMAEVMAGGGRQAPQAEELVVSMSSDPVAWSG